MEQTDAFGSMFKDRKERINPGSGALSLSFTDLTLPGRNGLNVVLKRNYQSNQSNLYRASTEVTSAEAEVRMPEHEECRLLARRAHFVAGNRLPSFVGPGDICDRANWGWYTIPYEDDWDYAYPDWFMVPGHYDYHAPGYVGGTEKAIAVRASSYEFDQPGPRPPVRPA